MTRLRTAIARHRVGPRPAPRGARARARAVHGPDHRVRPRARRTLRPPLTPPPAARHGGRQAGRDENRSRRAPTSASVVPASGLLVQRRRATRPTSAGGADVSPPTFVEWLDRPPGARWLDVGCGTGALTEAVLVRRAVGGARRGSLPGFFASACGGARRGSRGPGSPSGTPAPSPFRTARFDVVVSGLMLNFVPGAEAGAARRCAARSARRDVVAAYVWDYPDGMQLMSHFWDAAVDLDPRPPARARGVAVRLLPARPAALDVRRGGGPHRRRGRRRSSSRRCSATSTTTGRPFLGGSGPGARVRHVARRGTAHARSGRPCATDCPPRTTDRST